jgi:hypothetical protein
MLSEFLQVRGSMQTWIFLDYAKAISAMSPAPNGAE